MADPQAVNNAISNATSIAASIQSAILSTIKHYHEYNKSILELALNKALQRHDDVSARTYQASLEKVKKLVLENEPHIINGMDKEEAEKRAAWIAAAMKKQGKDCTYYMTKGDLVHNGSMEEYAVMNISPKDEAAYNIAYNIAMIRDGAQEFVQTRGELEMATDSPQLVKLGGENGMTAAEQAVFRQTMSEYNETHSGNRVAAYFGTDNCAYFMPEDRIGMHYIVNLTKERLGNENSKIVKNNLLIRAAAELALQKAVEGAGKNEVVRIQNANEPSEYMERTKSGYALYKDGQLRSVVLDPTGIPGFAQKTPEEQKALLIGYNSKIALDAYQIGSPVILSGLNLEKMRRMPDDGNGRGAEEKKAFARELFAEQKSKYANEFGIDINTKINPQQFETNDLKNRLIAAAKQQHEIYERCGLPDEDKERMHEIYKGAREENRLLTKKEEKEISDMGKKIRLSEDDREELAFAHNEMSYCQDELEKKHHLSERKKFEVDNVSGHGDVAQLERVDADEEDFREFLEKSGDDVEANMQKITEDVHETEKNFSEEYTDKVTSSQSITETVNSPFAELTEHTQEIKLENLGQPEK